MAPRVPDIRDALNLINQLAPGPELRDALVKFVEAIGPWCVLRLPLAFPRGPGSESTGVQIKLADESLGWVFPKGGAIQVDLGDEAMAAWALDQFSCTGPSERPGWVLIHDPTHAAIPAAVAILARAVERRGRIPGGCTDCTPAGTID